MTNYLKSLPSPIPTRLKILILIRYDFVFLIKLAKILDGMEGAFKTLKEVKIYLLNDSNLSHKKLYSYTQNIIINLGNFFGLL